METEPKEPVQKVPGVKAQVVITLFDDGDFTMDGPWEDRLIFEGLMSIGTDHMQSQFRQLAAQLMRKRAQEEAGRIAKPSFYERKQIEKNQRG